MNKIFAPFLPPWVETGLQPAFYDMESGTVLQQVARMYAKVQQLTRLFNELSEETKTTVEEYIAKFDVLEGKFVELKEFVEDYFDNLDVQEEINNKLDAMVEDGTLGALIGTYVDSYVAETNDKITATNARIDSVENTLYTELPQTDNVEVTQALIYDFPNATTSAQGMCIDDANKAYVYKLDSGGYGDLLKLDITNHTYIGTISHVKLYHANGLLWKNGKIYSATLKDEDENYNNKKIAIYDIANATTSEISPFGDLAYANVSLICDYDENHVLVGLNAVAGNSSLSNLHIVKLNLTDYTYTEYTNVFDREIDGSHAVGLQIIDGKLYILGSKANVLFEMLINEDNLTLTLNKIINIGDKDELGLDIGEIEGIATFPSGLYGNKTFVLGSYTITNTAGGNASYHIYLSNLDSKLMPYYGSIYDSNKEEDPTIVYVKASSTSLLQAGTSTYPFKELSRAIYFANSKKINVKSITIQDSGTYNIGIQYNKQARIEWGTYTPTIKIGELRSCKIFLQGNGNATINRTSASAANFNINNSSFYMGTGTIVSPVYIAANSNIALNGTNFTGDNIITAFEVHASRFNAKFGTVTGYTNKVVAGRDGALIVVNSAVGANCGVATGAVLLIAES